MIKWWLRDAFFDTALSMGRIFTADLSVHLGFFHHALAGVVSCICYRRGDLCCDTQADDSTLRVESVDQMMNTSALGLK